MPGFTRRRAMLGLAATATTAGLAPAFAQY